MKNVEELTENEFYITDNGNIFNISFDKIFGREQLSAYNEFEMTAKRNFKNLSPMILETYEEIFLDEGGKFNSDLSIILFNMLSAKSTIMTSTLQYNTFIEIIDKVINSGDELLLKTIDTFVEERYSLSLDKITEDTKNKNKKVNKELQFSDNHAKILLKIAYLYRIMIPIISVYFTYNKTNINESEDEEFDENNSQIFAYLFEKFAKNPKALRNKLYKLTYSRISKTAYSDKRFWSAAKNVGITKDTEALEIYRKLLTNAIPKLSIDGDKNIVSFLQSVINNQIDFLFQNKFKYRFTSLTNETEKYGNDDDDEISEFERVEIMMSRADEGSFIIRQMNIKDVLPTIPQKLGVGVDDSEVKFWMNKISRNTIQEQIIALMTFKYFDDKEALKFIDFYGYVYLLLACKKFLEIHKFIYLPQILVANCEKHKERVNICGKKVRPEIMNSKKYLELFNSKYSNFSEEIDKPFLAFIGTTYSSVFTDANGNELFDSNVKVGKIAEEIVDLASLV